MVILPYPQLPKALTAGFKVEVWAWRVGCRRHYLDMQRNYAGSFKLNYLDNYRWVGRECLEMHVVM